MPIKNIKTKIMVDLKTEVKPSLNSLVGNKIIQINLTGLKYIIHHLQG